MKKYIFAVIIIILVLVLVVFSVTEKREEVRIAASVFPVYNLVLVVAGDDLNVGLLIPPGASPHTLDLTPKMAQMIEKAEVIFAIGHGLDDFLLKDNRKVMYVDKGVIMKENEHEDEHHDEDEHHEDEHKDEHHDDHDHGPTDPHYWLSPSNAHLIVETIAEKLSEIDPENAGNYARRAEEYKMLLADKEEEWREMDVAGGKIITFHDAFSYFADYFNIEVIATVESAAGREPTARELAKLQSLITEHGITTIFLEPQLSAGVISQFARDNNLRLDVLDPLGGNPETGSYMELIEYNLRKIKESL